MYTLNFILKQHTPMIHFLWEQDGATLRATEVKPKLDKFIWDKWAVEENGHSNAFHKYAKYLTGYDYKKPQTIKKKFDKGFRALDYKLHLKATGSNFSYKKEIVSKEEALFLYEGLEGEISTYHIEVKEKIKSELSDFFIINNFAKRISKGYGSFLVSRINNESLILDNAEILNTIKEHFIVFRIFEENLKSNKIYQFNSANLFKCRRPDGLNDEQKRLFKKLTSFIYTIPRDIINDNQLSNFCLNNNLSDAVKNDYIKQVEIHKEEIIHQFPSCSREIDEKIKKILQQNIDNQLFVTFYNNLLSFIENANRILKSGINPGYEKGYIKSKLFKHFIGKSIIWEKRLIKKKINQIPMRERENISLFTMNYPPSVDAIKEHNSWTDIFNDNQYRFIRAILGLPEQYEFKTDRNNTKFVVQFESENAERFKSPLFFKIIENRIYACMEKDYSAILDQHFKVIFLIREREGKGWKNIAGPIELYNSLSTPTLEELNKQEFETFLQNYFESIDHDN